MTGAVSILSVTPTWISVAAAAFLVAWLFQAVKQIGRSTRSRRLDWIVLLLRLSALVLLALAIVRPLVKTERLEENAKLLVLVDTSESMSVRDADADSPAMTRMDEVKRIVNSAELKRWTGGLDVRYFGFDSEIHSWNPNRIDAPIGRESRIADGLTELIQSTSHDAAAVLLFSDGRATRGDELAPAAIDSPPLFTWLVGGEREGDAKLNRFNMDDRAVVGAPKSVQVEVSGVPFGEERRLRLWSDGALLGETMVAGGSNGTSVAMVEWVPASPGLTEIRAEIEHHPDDTHELDNQRVMDVLVEADPPKVLWVERVPRWEFRFAQNELAREAGIEFRCLLTEGGAGLADAEDSPYLEKAPSGADEWSKYEAVILGDVAEADLPPRTLLEIRDWTARGGLLILSAGESLVAEVRNAPLVDVAPVRFASEANVQPVMAEVELTPMGAREAVGRLSEDPAENLRLWRFLPRMAPTLPSTVALKPGAELLAVLHAGPGASHPLIVRGRYGLGTVILLGAEDFWRMRYDSGESVHARFWRQLTGGAARRGTRARVEGWQLWMSAVSATEGEPVEFRLRSEGNEWAVDRRPPRVVIRDSDQREREIAFKVLDDGSESLSGRVRELATGRYGIVVDGNELANFNLRIRASDDERRNVNVNPAQLAQLAEARGGMMVNEETVAGALRSAIERRESSAQSRLADPTRSAPFLILLIISLVGDWTVRRLGGLR